jgi:flavin-binding protein dodecin
MHVGNVKGNGVMESTETVYGSSTNSLEDAVQAALATSKMSKSHKIGEVRKITLDIGGVRGGTEYRVEVRLA